MEHIPLTSFVADRSKCLTKVHNSILLLHKTQSNYTFKRDETEQTDAVIRDAMVQHFRK